MASLAALHAAENRSEDSDNRLTQLRADPKSKRGIAFEDPYTDIYRAAVERRMREAATRRSQTKKDVQEDISTACAAWMLAARSGENRYRDFALELYDRFLKEQVEHDFHVTRPFGLVTLQMHTAGVLTGERRDLARGQALERITWFLDRRKNEDRYFDCNIALADTLAVACLARAFADDPALRAGEIRRAVAALGRRILETGDLNENASNYASLGICFFEEYEGRHPHCNLRALFDQWIDLGDRPLHCEVSRAEARQLGPDAWGRVEFTDYNGPGNSLQRRLVLTREGILVIVDTFTAGPRCDGWAGGQLWQLYTLQERGADWFSSESDGVYTMANGSTAERRMLVKFMASPGVTIDGERVQPTTMHAPKADGSRHREFFTTYSKRVLSAGQTTVSALAVLPLRTGANAARLAECLALESRADQEVRVTIMPPALNAQVSVKISADVVAVERADAANPKSYPP